MGCTYFKCQLNSARHCGPSFFHSLLFSHLFFPAALSPPLIQNVVTMTEKQKDTVLLSFVPWLVLLCACFKNRVSIHKVEKSPF